MADTNKLQRSLRILWKLARERDVTVNDLYDFLDGAVTRRSIQRTLRDLSEANIPISCRSGKHNEYRYSLKHPFDHIPETLSADEILAASLLSQSAGIFEGTRIGDDIRAVFVKLEQLLPKDAVAAPGAFGAEQYVHSMQTGNADLRNRSEQLQTMLRAILGSRVCRVHYRAKRYLFHPHALLLYNGSVYIVGRQPAYGNMIYLALTRLAKAELLDDQFARDPDFDLRRFLGNTFGIWYEEPEDVRIRFDPAVRASIEHRVWHQSQHIDEDADGGITLRMRVGPSLELVAWILRWGAHAEVVAPTSLRAQISDTAAAIQRRYRRSRPAPKRLSSR